jgi:hypothetical protein
MLDPSCQITNRSRRLPIEYVIPTIPIDPSNWASFPALIDPPGKGAWFCARPGPPALPPFPTLSPSRTDRSDFDTLIGDADGIDNPVSDKV